MQYFTFVCPRTNQMQHFTSVFTRIYMQMHYFTSVLQGEICRCNDSHLFYKEKFADAIFYICFTRRNLQVQYSKYLGIYSNFKIVQMYHDYVRNHHHHHGMFDPYRRSTVSC